MALRILTSSSFCGSGAVAPNSLSATDAARCKALSATLALTFTGCDKKEETKTVDWYMAPENKDALDAKLKECRNNPGELKDTPNCQNAELARHKLFVRKPATPIDFDFKQSKPEQAK